MAQKLNITWLDVTDSTNNRAQDGIPTAEDRSVWAALFQTQGRGQRGNTWKASKGENLTFSILLKPDFIFAQDQFIVSAIVTLGLHKYLQNKGIESRIKWPNDIYVGDRKIVGILIENGISGNNLSTSICGIGLNLNQREFPKDLPNPTSVILELERLGTPVSKMDLKTELELLLTDIFSYYDKARSEFLAKGNYNVLYDEYLANLYRRGEFHRYIETATGKDIRARIIGLDEYACLILEYEDGTRKSFAFKEISYII
ncbi:MAG: biotin--[acetyl-CoA-carboxylase] ligase [Bacteroidales bacterium]|nr:biotin--[acetyl-CoA-carboxylase] ligase [Bacteroidales bacterium]